MFTPEMNTKLHSLVLATLLLVGLQLAPCSAELGVSITVAPPVLPVVEQPPCPVEGYIWTPGYWAYDTDYYWVPGVWVPPPEVGLLWTPPWWGFVNGAYLFHEGYWGPTVGFYGGINYGFGYFGTGYLGGGWAGNVFRYNTAVTRVNTTVVHNTFVDRTLVSRQTTTNRASFNGQGGVKAEATAEERAAANARHVPATSEQISRKEAASKNRELHAAVNHGQPNTAAIKSLDHGGAKAQGIERGKVGSENLANKTENAARGERVSNKGKAHSSGLAGNTHGDVSGHHHRTNATAMTSHHAAAYHRPPPGPYGRPSTAQQRTGKTAKPQKKPGQHQG
jgi:WXXGXW repeat (2 copies)